MRMWPGVLAAAGILLASSARPQDAGSVLKARAAEVYTLARLAPILCKGVEADEGALAALLDRAQITEADIMDPAQFGTAAANVAHSFAQSFKDRPEASCASLYEGLGENGAGLIRHKPGTPG